MRSPESWIGPLVAGLGVAAFTLVDRRIVGEVAGWQAPGWTEFFLAVTHIAFLFPVLYAVPAVLLWRRRRAEAIFLLLTPLFAGFLALALKHLVSRARPDSPMALSVAFGDFSFPSMHAVLAFAALPFVWRHLGRARFAFGGVAVLIALSRLYLGAHYPSDIMAGALLGLLCGHGMHRLAEHTRGPHVLEVRRQVFHAVFGMGLTGLLWMEWLDWRGLLALLGLGLGVSLLQKWRPLPFISWFLRHFDRQATPLPGWGPLTFVVGVLVAVAFLPRTGALAGTMVLTLGDSAATLFGKLCWRTPLPLNPSKSVQGTIIGFFVGCFGAVLFVPLWAAAVMSALGMVVEAYGERIFKVDDNFLIPLISGIFTIWYL